MQSLNPADATLDFNSHKSLADNYISFYRQYLNFLILQKNREYKNRNQYIVKFIDFIHAIIFMTLILHFLFKFWKIYIVCPISWWIPFWIGIQLHVLKNAFLNPLAQVKGRFHGTWWGKKLEFKLIFWLKVVMPPLKLNA